MTPSRAAAGRSAERYAEKAKDQPALKWPARVGFACYRLVYLVIGWMAAQLALGRPTGSISGNGAFSQLAHEPLGRLLVWVTAGGFAALVVWEACQAIGGHRDQHGLRRAGGRLASAGRGVIFAALDYAAVSTALGSGAEAAPGARAGRRASRHGCCHSHGGRRRWAPWVPGCSPSPCAASTAGWRTPGASRSTPAPSTAPRVR